MAGFGNSLTQAFNAAVPMGFKAREQLLREKALQGQIGEVEYARQTREQATEAGLSASAAPIVDSQPSSVRDESGVMQATGAAPTPDPRRAPPAWQDLAAAEAQAQVYLQRGDPARAAEVTRMARTRFENRIKDAQYMVNAALNAGDVAGALRAYDENVPGAGYFAAPEVGEDGSMTLTRHMPGGEPMTQTFASAKEAVAALRPYAQSMTDPGQLDELRSSAVKNSFENFKFGAQAAFAGDIETAEKLLGPGVKVVQSMGQDGVPDTELVLPGGKRVSQNQLNGMTAAQAKGLGLGFQKTEAETERTKEQTKTEGSRRGLMAAQADAARASTEASRRSGATPTGPQATPFDVGKTVTQLEKMLTDPTQVPAAAGALRNAHALGVYLPVEVAATAFNEGNVRQEVLPTKGEDGVVRNVPHMVFSVNGQDIPVAMPFGMKAVEPPKEPAAPTERVLRGLATPKQEAQKAEATARRKASAAKAEGLKAEWKQYTDNWTGEYTESLDARSIQGLLTRYGAVMSEENKKFLRGLQRKATLDAPATRSGNR